MTDRLRALVAEWRTYAQSAAQGDGKQAIVAEVLSECADALERELREGEHKCSASTERVARAIYERIVYAGEPLAEVLADYDETPAAQAADGLTDGERETMSAADYVKAAKDCINTMPNHAIWCLQQAEELRRLAPAGMVSVPKETVGRWRNLTANYPTSTQREALLHEFDAMIAAHERDNRKGAGE